jgi:hypothetical protein
MGTDICNIRVPSLQHMQHPKLLLQHPHGTLESWNIPTEHLKYLKHTLATWRSLGLDNSSHWGRNRHRVSTTTTTIASSTKLGSAGRVARMTGRSERRRMGECDGQERAARDRRTAAARRSWHAAFEPEGRHVGEGQRRVGGAVDAPASIACVRQ